MPSKKKSYGGESVKPKFEPTVEVCPNPPGSDRIEGKSEMDRPRVESNFQSAARNSADKDYMVANSSLASRTLPPNLNVPGITSPWGKSNHISDAHKAAQINASAAMQRVSPALPLPAAAVLQPEPVIRASNSDLQSQLRDLLKCGSSSNMNPFAPKRVDVPLSVSLQGSATAPAPSIAVEQFIRSSPSATVDLAPLTPLISGLTPHTVVTPLPAQPAVPVLVSDASNSTGSTGGSLKYDPSPFRVGPREIDPAPVPSPAPSLEIRTALGPSTSSSSASATAIVDARSAISIPATGSVDDHVEKNKRSNLCVDTVDTTQSPRGVGGGLDVGVGFQSLLMDGSRDLLGFHSMAPVPPSNGSTNPPDNASPGPRGGLYESFSLSENSFTRELIKSPIRSPVRSPARVPSVTSYEPENTMSNLFGPKSFSLTPDGTSGGEEIFGAGRSLFGSSLSEQNNALDSYQPLQIQQQPLQIQHQPQQLQQQLQSQQLQQGMLDEDQGGPQRMPPPMHPMSLFQGQMPPMHHGGYYPPHMGLGPPPLMPHLHMPMPPHMQYPHPPFRGPGPGPPGMMMHPYPQNGPGVPYPLGMGGARHPHPMEIGPPPGMYPMMYNQPIYNMNREPPEMRHLDGEYMRLELQGQGQGQLLGQPMGQHQQLQDMRYDQGRRGSPFHPPGDKDGREYPQGLTPEDPGPPVPSLQPLQTPHHTMIPLPSLFGVGFSNGDVDGPGREEREHNEADRLRPGHFNQDKAHTGMYGQVDKRTEDLPFTLRADEGTLSPRPDPLGHPALSPSSSVSVSMSAGDLLGEIRYSRPIPMEHTHSSMTPLDGESSSIFAVDPGTISMSPQREETRAPRAAFISYLSGERQTVVGDRTGDLSAAFKSLQVEDGKDSPKLLEQLQSLHLKQQEEHRQSQVQLQLEEKVTAKEILLKVKQEQVEMLQRLQLLEQQQLLRRQPEASRQQELQRQSEARLQQDMVRQQELQQLALLQKQQQQQEQQKQEQKQQQQQQPTQPLQLQTAPQKGQALLSLLRSSVTTPPQPFSPFQLGPRPPGLPIPPPGPSALGGDTRGDRGGGDGALVGNNSYADANDVIAQRNDVASTSTPKSGIHSTRSSTDDLACADVTSLPAPLSTDAPIVAKKVGLYRHTRGQEGVLVIGINNCKAQRSPSAATKYMLGTSSRDDAVFDCEGAVVRPGGAMTVIWQVPEAMFMDPGNLNLSIGLVRYGALSNFPCVVAKALGPLNSSTIRSRDMLGNAVVKGRLPFHAPKAAGPFVYRLFDQSTKERLLVTLGTSPIFQVRIFDFEVTSNLRFCFEAFEDKCRIKGVTQLHSIIVGMCNQGKSTRKDDPRQLMQYCVKSVLELIQQGVGILDEAKDRDREKREKYELKALHSEDSPLPVPVSAGGEEDPKKAPKAKEDDMLVRQTGRLQMELYDTLLALRKNEIAWSLIREDQRQQAVAAVGLYSNVLNRFFSSTASLAKALVAELGFLPSSAPSSHMPTRQMHKNSVNYTVFNRSIMEALPSLMPAADFAAKRERIRLSVQEAVRSTGVVPPLSEIALYGSSMNNFGNDDADMDMCVIFPAGSDIAREDRPQAVQALGAALEAQGMLDVKIRPTARIPIVQFVDKVSGAQCDVSFSNSLAISNTQLLRTYSQIDPRIRPLAYIIKHWARARHINSPADGTLSSYGYVICLLHFLQNRPVPLVPNLQRLPPDWTGLVLSPHDIFNDTDLELNTTDGSACSTYFYKPASDPRKIGLLAAFASRNNETIAELLAEFFAHFAWEFDFNASVVSLQSGKEKPVSKIQKAELDGWPQHDRLSIEDPFETWYDVAHVVKSYQMTFIRKEFLRAHTIATQCLSTINTDAARVLPEQLLTSLCEGSDPPPFSSAGKAEKALRRNTMESLAEFEMDL